MPVCAAQQSFPTSTPRLQVYAACFPLPLFQMVNGVLVDVENLRDCFRVVCRFVTLYQQFPCFILQHFYHLLCLLYTCCKGVTAFVRSAIVVLLPGAHKKSGTISTCRSKKSCSAFLLNSPVPSLAHLYHTISFRQNQHNFVQLCPHSSKFVQPALAMLYPQAGSHFRQKVIRLAQNSFLHIAHRRARCLLIRTIGEIGQCRQCIASS